jgi:methionine-rich copper-binding protein CopC
MKRGVHVAWVGLLLAALALTATVTAQVASAHATRVSSQPADNAVLTAGPDQVSATFNEQLQTSFAAMAVVGPDGNLWSTGQPTVQGAVVGVGVRPLGPAGTYTVNYRVTSADGHVVSGSWSFRLTVPGTGTPGPSATDAGGRARTWVPTWPFLMLTLALVAAAAWWAMRRRP